MTASMARLISAGLAIGLFVVAAALYGVLILVSKNPDLPLMAVGGFLVFAAALGGLAALFSWLRISEHPHALALPEGSVRALIALVLVVLFVAIAAFLFTHLDGKHSPAQVDLAKQIFTTIATVLVTIIGFYFGSRSTAERRGSGPHRDSELAAEAAEDARQAELAAAEALAEADDETRAAVKEAYERAHAGAAEAQRRALEAAVAHSDAERQSALQAARDAADTAREAARAARTTLQQGRGGPGP